ncbi:hypothetical protein Y032_0026g1358 [Ancylostoma ceylanicum]|uniref:Uncharacterized protein n=1 Tax=Ancylostoma ceylanicum TaxID=53326 RepID=A0A016UVE4_9BILA|nr:hypothetical protein Y032_0026g1358 [Ancylostoma ceylanicum]
MTSERPNDLVLISGSGYNSPIVDEPGKPIRRDLNLPQEVQQTNGLPNPGKIYFSVAQAFYALYGVPFFVIIAYVMFVYTYRMKMEEVLKKLAEVKPKLPKCGRIDENNFEFCGPLKLQSKFKGNVEHALVNEHSQPIEELVYDENLNEVVDIGSNVEEIEVKLLWAPLLTLSSLKASNMSLQGISEITMSAQRVGRSNSVLFATMSGKKSRIMSKKGRKASIRNHVLSAKQKRSKELANKQ